MSDLILVALIGSGGSVLAAVLSLIGVVISLNTRKVNIETRDAAIEAKGIALKTEKNTNSLTEALVASTKVAAHAEGKEEGRLAGEEKAAALAAGALAERTSK